MKYAEKIKYYRNKKGFSQIEIARKIGISQAAYGKIESGFTKSISIDIGKKIANVLNISFAELFEIKGIDAETDKLNDLVTEQQEKIKELENRIKEKDQLINFFKAEHYNLKKAIAAFEITEESKGIVEVEYDVNNAKTEKEKAELLFRLKSYKEMYQWKIQDILDENILSKSDVLSLIFENDVQITILIESESDFENEFYSYVNQYLEVSKEEIKEMIIKNKVSRANYDSLLSRIVPERYRSQKQKQ